jgi:hypothetical protein
MNQTTLNVAEASVFSRTATYRLKPELSHLTLRSISVNGSDVCINTFEGEIILPKEIYIEHFLEYRQRCPDYFDYVGPRYETRVYWKPGFYFLPTGWVTRFRQCAHLDVLVGQHNVIKTLKSMKDFHALNDMISYPGQQYGYLVAHEGLLNPLPGVDIPIETPYCTCGSFQLQWRNRDLFKSVLGEDHVPTCKHISYMHAFDELRQKSSALLCHQSELREYKTLAYWYLPPESNLDSGVLKALYINDQPMRTIEHWSLYKSNAPITQDQIWKFFHTALDNGYLIKYAMSIPTLRDFCQHHRE